MRAALKICTFITLLIFLMSISIVPVTAAGTATFQNPVLNESGDPYCFEDNGYYYLYLPDSIVQNGVHVGGRVLCFRSQNLLDWTALGEVYNNTNESYNGENTLNLWAPEVHKVNGKYYLYCVYVMDNAIDPMGNKDIVVIEGTSPTSFDSSKRTVLLDGSYVFLDPTLFKDSDGSLYLYYKKRDNNIVGSQLNVRPMGSPTSFSGNSVKIFGSTDVPNAQGILEHPFVQMKNGHYILFFSYGVGETTTYKIGYATAGNPMGPFAQASENPIMYTNQTSGVIAPGATSIVLDGAGNRWMVYRQKVDSTEGWNRVVCINRCIIDLNGNVDITATRTNYADSPVSLPFSDDFNDGNANGWTASGGTWSVTNGQYKQTSTTPGKSLVTGANYTDFTYEADVKLDGNDNAGLLFRVENVLGTGADEYQGYYVGLNAANDFVRLGKANNNWTIISTTNMTINVGTTYHVKIVCSGSNIKVYVGDMNTPKINANDSTWTTGQIGVRSFNVPATFDNINIK